MSTFTEKQTLPYGHSSNVCRSTIADANEQRDWRIYADLAYALIDTARDLYSTETFLANLDETVYALDSTTIDLCLSLFPWATFRKNKGQSSSILCSICGGNIPTFIHISDGKLNKLAAPMAIFDQCVNHAGVEIDASQQGDYS